MVNFVTHPLAFVALVVFLVAYVLVLIEEKIALRKSKPVIIAAGLIWVIVSLIVGENDVDPHVLQHALHETIAEYGALLLFLIVAMTYIAALEERNVFESLRVRLLRSGLSYRGLFWVTGILAFLLSPIADNMTTAMVMGAIILILCKERPDIIPLYMVNVVSAANAGGAFSPFGDITTLMVWHADKLNFLEFLPLIGPSVACYLVPAFLMSYFTSKDIPSVHHEIIHMKRGAPIIIALGLLTVCLAVGFEQFLHLPSFMGMMTGLGLLFLFGHFVSRKYSERSDAFHVFSLMRATEWDTLLFFFGVIFSISGLAFLGYLQVASTELYGTLGANVSNILIGAISAIFDNIPLMFAVLKMSPEMTQFEWQLVTLTLGTGGSLLSIGSAAGIALMGTAHGIYSFSSHLRWTPLLILGYAAGIGTHFLLNA